MRNRPLIVHIVHRLDVGGLENGLVNLVNASAGSFRHAIICLTTAGRFAARLASGDVQVVELRKKPGKDFGAYLRLWRILRHMRPALVHTRNFGTLDCQFVAAAAGVPCRVHGEHGWDMGDLSGTSTARLLLRRISRLVVDRYVAVSQHLADWLVDHVRLPAARVTCIINGVDAGRFAPPAVRGKQGETCRFLYVGRLDPVKGPDVLMDAFAMVCAIPGVGDRVSLTLVGDGPLLETIAARVRDLGQAGRVHLNGASDDVPGCMAEADVFVLPSRNEGISNTVLEAMASGLPVIATATGGNPEIVTPGTTGQLVPVEDAGALAAAMVRYVQDRPLAAEHGRQSREIAVARFSLQAMVGAYERLYAELLSFNGGELCVG